MAGGQASLRAARNQFDQPIIIGDADVMRVDAVELGQIEAGRGAVDVGDVELTDRVLGRMISSRRNMVPMLRNASGR